MSLSTYLHRKLDSIENYFDNQEYSRCLEIAKPYIARVKREKRKQNSYSDERHKEIKTELTDMIYKLKIAELANLYKTPTNLEEKFGQYSHAKKCEIFNIHMQQMEEFRKDCEKSVKELKVFQERYHYGPQRRGYASTAILKYMWQKEYALFRQTFNQKQQQEAEASPIDLEILKKYAEVSTLNEFIVKLVLHKDQFECIYKIYDLYQLKILGSKPINPDYYQSLEDNFAILCKEEIKRYRPSLDIWSGPDDSEISKVCQKFNSGVITQEECFATMATIQKESYAKHSELMKRQSEKLYGKGTLDHIYQDLETTPGKSPNEQELGNKPGKSQNEQGSSDLPGKCQNCNIL